jgi:hypothetical protein
MVFTDYVLSSVLASVHDAMLKSPAS